MEGSALRCLMLMYVSVFSNSIPMTDATSVTGIALELNPASGGPKIRQRTLYAL